MQISPTPQPSPGQRVTEQRTTGAAFTPAPAQNRQQDTVEAPAAPEVDPKLQAMARKERALQIERQKFNVEKADLQKKLSDYETNYIPKSTLTQKLSEDPIGFMNEHGLTYDQLTQVILNKDEFNSPVYKNLVNKLKSIEEQQNATQKQFAEQQQRDYDQAVTQIRNDSKLLVDSDSRFETIKETNSSEAIVELIRETFDTQGRLLSVEEAAQTIEDYLVEEGFKMAQLNKIKAKLIPPPSPEQQTQPQMKTLTNAVSASSKPLTRKDRRERAMLAGMGKLNT